MWNRLVLPKWAVVNIGAAAVATVAAGLTSSYAVCTASPEIPLNLAPTTIISLSTPLSDLQTGREARLAAVTTGIPVEESVVYRWTSSAGEILLDAADGSVVRYSAPSHPGPVIIKVVSTTEQGLISFSSLVFSVSDAPEITSSTDTIVRISEPRTSQTVDASITVKGTYESLLVDSQIWTVLYAHGLYWPQERAALSPKGGWISTTRSGDLVESGWELSILAVWADEDADKQFSSWLERDTQSVLGFRELPPTAQVFDSVDVVQR